MRRFWIKLLLFFTPLVVVYSVPLLTMTLSKEILPAAKIARTHAEASDPNIVYGPAYTNPDKRYKLESLVLHDAPVVAIGTSRVMQFRSSFFDGGEKTFYNAGGLVSRIWHVRRVFAHLPPGRMRYVILGLDQWAYNDKSRRSTDDPSVEAEYTAEADALANLRHGMQAWPDLLNGKIALGKLVTGFDHLGVYARMKGNGFRRDGSYFYADVIHDPSSGPDYQFRDTLTRIRGGKEPFEGGSTVSESALEETRRLLDACRARGLKVVAFLPPFAPTILDAMRASPDHTYLVAVPASVRAVVEAAGVPFFDFTSCADDGCLDDEFVDGSHGGDALFGRLLVRMANEVPWLAEVLESTMKDRTARARGRMSLD